MKFRFSAKPIGAVVGGCLSLWLMCGCQQPMHGNSSTVPLREINAVLKDHDRELLSKRGVTGVYVGLMPDGKTPCLKVMLIRKDAQLERSIPRVIEGYPVVLEVTGEITPLGK
jgi:hypothetical protein